MAAQEKLSPEDKEYRSKSIATMFRQALFGVLGGAAFYGVLQGLTQLLLEPFKASTVGQAAAEAVKVTSEIGMKAAAESAAATSGSILGVLPAGWLVIGGLMAVGVVFTYMSQIEATKLRELQDDRLARKNAECLTVSHSHSPILAQSQEIEHEQNQRADGKKWAAVIAANENQLAQGAAR